MLVTSHPIALHLQEKAGFIFLIPPGSSSGCYSQQQNLTLTSLLRLEKPRSLIHMLQPWPSWWHTNELTPVHQRLSCARSTDLELVLLVWSHQCWAAGQDQCLALLLCLCKCSSSCRGCFAAQEHCCLLATWCPPGPFLQNCCVSVYFYKTTDTFQHYETS